MAEQPLVLIVDDEDDFLEITSVALNTAGFQTESTKYIEDAIEKAMSLKPNFILSDVYFMSGSNGWDLALALHRNKETSQIPFAFFTSLRDPWLEISSDTRQEALAELGPVIFFDKSDDLDLLPKRVRNLISNKISNPV